MHTSLLLLFGHIPLDEVPVGGIHSLLVGVHVHTTPIIEAHAGLCAQITSRDPIADGGRGLSHIAERGKHCIAGAHVQSQVAVVEVLENADGCIAGTEAVIQAGVDIPGIGDAALNKAKRLSPEGELEPVTDKAGSRLLEDDGLAIEGLEQLFGKLEDSVARVGAAADLKEGNHVSRVERVRDYDAVFV